VGQSRVEHARTYVRTHIHHSEWPHTQRAKGSAVMREAFECNGYRRPPPSPRARVCKRSEVCVSVFVQCEQESGCARSFLRGPQEPTRHSEVSKRA
jgi:hypothetical protein